MTVERREDKLVQLKDTYSKNLQSMVELVSNNFKAKTAQKQLLVTHNSAVAFFNEFERTLDEYSLPGVDLSKDVINRKVEDCINIIATITLHWDSLRAVSKKYELVCPQPSTTAYASIQRVLKRFKPELVESIRSQFVEHDLPVYGFVNEAEHSGFEPRRTVLWQYLAGSAFVVVGITMSFIFNKPTPMEYFVLRGIIAAGVTLVVSVFLQGTLNIQWKMTSSLAVRATGFVAFFILLYYLNPPGLPQP